jgi:hypothetical protein
MDIKKILFYVVIVLIIYSLYKWLFRDPASSNLLDMGSGKEEKIIKSEKLKGNKDSTFFAYSFWIYVSSWEAGKEKILIKKGGEGEYCPKIALDSNVNDLIITLATLGTTGGSSNSQTKKIKNIPLQKWTHIVITTNNQSMDSYIDGKLVKTFLLGGSPKIYGDKDIHICPGGGYDGYIAKVRYYSRTLNPREVYELYKEGPAKGIFGNLLGKYKLKFAYYVDNKEEGNLTI